MKLIRKVLLDTVSMSDGFKKLKKIEEELIENGWVVKYGLLGGLMIELEDGLVTYDQVMIDDGMVQIYEKIWQK